MNDEQPYGGSDGQDQRVLSEATQMEKKVEAYEHYQAYPGVNLLEERDRQRQQLGRKLHELDQKLEASEGYRIYTKMKLLGKSYFLFDGNYLALKHVLEDFEHPATFLKLWEKADRHRLDLFMSDVIRLFHNYLAGARTLLYHVRAFEGDEYRGTSFAHEYQRRVEQQVEGSSLHHFVQDLPGYMLHKGFPVALAELNLGSVSNSVEVRSAIELNVTELRNWEKWSDKGREQLNTWGNKVKLGDIVTEHASLVTELYDWFRTRQSELHQRDLEELAQLQSEREGLQQELSRLEDLLELTEKAAGTMQEERQRLIRELTRARERANRLEADLEKARRPWWRR